LGIKSITPLDHRLGYRVYGLGAFALGVIGLIWRDFALVWQPVPQDVPGRAALACIVAVGLLFGGVGLQWGRTARLAAATLIGLYALDVLLLHAPRVVAHIDMFGAWSGLAEQLALLAGGLAAYAGLASASEATAARLARIARLAFGLCLFSFGLAHFFYLPQTAAMVPAWLPPGQQAWAYATGAAHILAGLEHFPT
jgi:uncharacterized membrane protein